jgi:hypothetical protein
MYVTHSNFSLLGKLEFFQNTPIFFLSAILLNEDNLVTEGKKLHDYERLAVAGDDKNPLRKSL